MRSFSASEHRFLICLRPRSLATKGVRGCTPLNKDQAEESCGRTHGRLSVSRPAIVPLIRASVKRQFLPAILFPVAETFRANFAGITARIFRRAPAIRRAFRAR